MKSQNGTFKALQMKVIGTKTISNFMQVLKSAILAIL
jgi:hypothetical protein